MNISITDDGGQASFLVTEGGAHELTQDLTGKRFVSIGIGDLVFFVDGFDADAARRCATIALVFTQAALALMTTAKPKAPLADTDIPF